MTINDKWVTGDISSNENLTGFHALAVGEKYSATIYDDGLWIIGDDRASMYFEGKYLSDFIARLQQLQALAQSRFGEDWGK